MGPYPAPLFDLEWIFNCLTPDNSFTRNSQNSYKGGKKFGSTYTGAGLHVSQQAQKIVCVFCQDKNWLD